MMKKICMVLIVATLFLSSAHFADLAYEEYQPFLNARSQKEHIQEEVILVENKDDPLYRVIDFVSLKEINKDVVGWLFIPGTSVDYPILVGDTDDKYLNTDIEGQESKLGSIFSFSDTDRNLQDARTVLFGHNMKEYQMFGELKRYLEQDFREQHKKMYVYTKEKSMELDVFSIFVCDKMDDIFWDDTVLGTEEYMELVLQLDERNVYDDLFIEDKDRICDERTFSLVTCKGSSGTSNRLIVSSIVVEEKYKVS